MSKKKLCVIDSHLTNYVLPVIIELSDYYDIDYLYSAIGKEEGFGDIFIPEGCKIKFKELKLLKPFNVFIGQYQTGIIKYIFSSKPDAIIIFANLRYFSFWSTLIIAKLFKIKIFPRGHGLFKKNKVSILLKLSYKIIFLLTDSYICYNDFVRNSFINFGFNTDKLAVAENTFVNKYTVLPEQVIPNKKGILFIGRLRTQSNLLLLVQVVEELRNQESADWKLHIIGGGEFEQKIKNEYKDKKWIYFYGSIYDDKKIKEISLNCTIGCYPGNVGLSIVHFFSLSLPVIIHSNLKHHNGPESSYLVDGINGKFFDYNLGKESLKNAIKFFQNIDNNKMIKMRSDAYHTYERLSNPPLSRKLRDIVESHFN